MKTALKNTSPTGSKPRWTGLIERLRSRIFCPEFRNRHRRRDPDFVRKRLFTFPVVTLLLLQKSTRSIQRHLHAFFGQHPSGGHATPGAWTQARAKLSHSALIELNQEVLLPEFYSPKAQAHRRNWRGHRGLKHGAHFVGRCSTRSFGQAQELFRVNRAGVSLVVQIKAPPAQRGGLGEHGLPEELTVRFVSVRLPEGKLEVLVTSLLEEKQYPTGEFLEVYHWRWGHETYYKTLKDNLDLENWSGRTLESVHQDVQASVLLCHLESLLSQEGQEVLSAGDHRRDHAAQINRKGRLPRDQRTPPEPALGRPATGGRGARQNADLAAKQSRPPAPRAQTTATHPVPQSILPLSAPCP